MRELNEEELKEFLESVYLIDESRLEEDLKELSYKYAELGVMLAKARAEYEAKKMQFQVLEANLAKHFRETLPKVTEKAVEEAIIRTSEWQEAKRQVIEAKQEVDLLSALVQALEAKRDVLITYLSWKKELVRMNKEFEI
jgi:molybdopterin-biosynthesis enzyme MoeA-like protein